MIPWKNTRSPSLNPDTLGPTAVMVPAASEPRTAGYEERKML